MRWLLRKFNLVPNACYNFLKSRKSVYHTQKQRVLAEIASIYHEHGGVDGYRSMKIYLERKGFCFSRLTIHRYMNQELELRSVVRRKKPGYRKGTPHKVFENLLAQDFTAESPNEKWCTDFTYLFLTDGSKRYNCSIIDLYDRSVIAGITDRNITSDLAIRTAKKALESQPVVKGELMLHSDQGSRYTSKDFIDFCATEGIRQSMSKAGYPYDNAPMERYYNTLKNELIYLHNYHTDEELIQPLKNLLM